MAGSLSRTPSTSKKGKKRSRFLKTSQHTARILMACLRDFSTPHTVSPSTTFMASSPNRMRCTESAQRLLCYQPSRVTMQQSLRMGRQGPGKHSQWRVTFTRRIGESFHVRLETSFNVSPATWGLTVSTWFGPHTSRSTTRTSLTCSKQNVPI